VSPGVEGGSSVEPLAMGVRAIHTRSTRSAGLGEYGPGVNVVVEFTAGHAWWKPDARRLQIEHPACMESDCRVPAR
jgi:hypothetical protein